MNIAITVPGLSIPHGGIRIIVEWANRLSINHNVTLFCRKGKQNPSWIDIFRNVYITDNEKNLKNCDRLIICSPHDIDLAWNSQMPKKKFIFLQMLEHLFKPGNINWAEKCNRMYSCNHPLILISKWNGEYIERTFFRRSSPLYYIGNGVNFDDFPMEPQCKKDGETVLVEGWELINPSKDLNATTHKVAQMLRDDGYRILAYGQSPLRKSSRTPHEYYVRPSKERLNDLYRRSTVLLKASRYDSRACAPMEAMTKGCVTARSLMFGDDDLIHNENCLRVGYPDVDGLYESAKTLLTNKVTLSRLRNNCIEYVKSHSWDYWMPQIEGIITNG